MVYQFQAYDPSRPRMVTSFKGNQKLIFEGYRYNIHHIVPQRGVKTWRCVCAKKLTSARSWCKGRAETCNNDSQGISKGDHNHAAEHDVAELEYFKSQLILAAIEYPLAPLNDLIDEAVSYMSAGVTFGSRESLKKSLTVARKSAENGGFKLKCYKNNTVPNAAHRGEMNGGGDEGSPSPSADTQPSPPPPIVVHRETTIREALMGARKREKKARQQARVNAAEMSDGRGLGGADGAAVNLADFGEAQMQSFLSLARQCQQRQLDHLQDQQQNDASLLFQHCYNNGDHGGSEHGSGVGAESGGQQSIASINSLLFNQLSAAAVALAASAASGHYGSGTTGGSRSSPLLTTPCSSTATTVASSSESFADSGLEMDLSGLLPPGGQFSTPALSNGSTALGLHSHHKVAKLEPGLCAHAYGRLGEGKGAQSSQGPYNGKMMGAAGGDGYESGNSSSARSTPISSIGAGAGSNTAQRSQIIQMQKKTARINTIFNKLSSKAVAAAASCCAPSSTRRSENHLSNHTSVPLIGGSIKQEEIQRKKKANSHVGNQSVEKYTKLMDASTQTQLISTSNGEETTTLEHPSIHSAKNGDYSLVVLSDTAASSSSESAGGNGGGGGSGGGGGIRLSKCLSSQRGQLCSCRVIRVCCCSEETNCWRRKKRQYQDYICNGSDSLITGTEHDLELDHLVGEERLELADIREQACSKGIKRQRRYSAD